MTCQSTEQLRTARPTATTDGQGTIPTTYRRLRILGFDEREAGNLAAYVSGIAIARQPWTVRELTHLLFLREMNRLGRRWSDADDRAATVAGARPQIGGSKPRDAYAPDGRLTGLALFRGMPGPGVIATHLAQPVYRAAEALDDRDQEGG
jgi:hypothetical protein